MRKDPSPNKQIKLDIEVTPAMERAGLEALWSFRPGLQDENSCEVIREVFQAMIRAVQLFSLVYHSSVEPEASEGSDPPFLIPLESIDSGTIELWPPPEKP